MTAHGATAAAPAYRDLNVLRWLAAYTASVVGDVMYFLALTWSATRAAGPSQAGFVITAAALPRALLMLGGGVVADRFGPRRVAMVSDATRCLVILAAAAAVLLTSPGLWLLVAVAAVFGVLDAVFMPAVGALPPRLTAAEQLARVQGMRGLSLRLSNFAGPLLAGAALALGGEAGTFAVAGLLFAVSMVLLLTVRMRPLPHGGGERTERGTARRELTDGLRYIRRHRTLAPLVTVVGLSEMCFSGPVAAGLVLLADERGWGAVGMGWIASAFSVGGAAAGLLLTVSVRVPRAGAAMSGALFATAAGTVAMGHTVSLPSAVPLRRTDRTDQRDHHGGVGSPDPDGSRSPLSGTRHLGHDARHPRPRSGALSRGRRHGGAVGSGRVLHRLRRDLPAGRGARDHRPGAAPGRTPGTGHRGTYRRAGFRTPAVHGRGRGQGRGRRARPRPMTAVRVNHRGTAWS